MQIEKRYTLACSCETLFQTWIDNDTVIPPATRMDINPVVGGHYRLIMALPDGEMRNEGTFSRIEPPHRLTYSWQWLGDDEVSEVDIRFEATGHNCTDVVICHSGFSEIETADRTSSGWDSYIDGLRLILEAR